MSGNLNVCLYEYMHKSLCGSLSDVSFHVLMHVCLSVCVSLCLDLWVYVWMSVWMTVTLDDSLNGWFSGCFLYGCLSGYLTVCHSVSPTVCMCGFCVCLYVWLHVYRFGCVFLSALLSVWISV